jgi:hypothetical protein
VPVIGIAPSVDISPRHSSSTPCSCHTISY